MYCPHDDIAAGGDDAVGDEDCESDCSTATVAAAPTSSISPPRPRAPPSKDPLTRGKAGSLGKWGRLITSGGAEGGDLGAGGADSGRGPADSLSVSVAAAEGYRGGDGARNRRGDW